MADKDGKKQPLDEEIIFKTAKDRATGFVLRWHAYGEREGTPPRLTQGWRAEVCGDLLRDVLNGKITLRVADPQSDHPLVFERRVQVS